MVEIKPLRRIEEICESLEAQRPGKGVHMRVLLQATYLVAMAMNEVEVECSPPVVAAFRASNAHMLDILMKLMNIDKKFYLATCAALGNDLSDTLEGDRP